MTLVVVPKLLMLRETQDCLGIAGLTQKRLCSELLFIRLCIFNLQNNMAKSLISLPCEIYMGTLLK